MRSVKKCKKQGKRHNEIVISDDIDTSESIVGVGQHNILIGEEYDEGIYNNFEVPTKNTCSNSFGKLAECDSEFLGDFKVSPELEFNLPTKFELKSHAKRSLETDKTLKPCSAKAGKIKSIGQVTPLPLLNIKKSIIDRDQIDVKSRSINDQIEKIEHRKLKMTIKEKNSRMKEILTKSKQNWSSFKAEIDFVKFVESDNVIPSCESADLIKDEKVLNSILNELSFTDIDGSEGPVSVHAESLISPKTGVGSLVDVDNQENMADFKSIIKPMLKSYTPKPVMEDQAMSLKQLLFNSTCRSWGTEWYRQNFEFQPSDSEIPFGMIQRMEGPNNVVCVVQAEFLVEALFKGDESVNWMCNLRRNRNQLLAATLARIISRCQLAKSDPLNVCLLDVKLKGRHFGTVKPDGITECITVYQLSTKEELQQFILHHISQFTDKLSPGLILLVVSCLLTHGISRCLQELHNDELRLISPLGQPRDELMNLLIIGKVTSHYFNDNVQVTDDSGNCTTLYGVPSRSSVGFLTIDSHCQFCKEIGTYLKTPRYPVWLAKLEDNNFVVLYCLNGNLVNDWKTEIKFQLNLYCPLLAKKGAMKMTVDSSVTQTEKSLLIEEGRRIEREKENKNKELTKRRLKNMSDSALKFVLDNESMEEYLEDDAALAQAADVRNSVEKVVYIKWPKANVSVNEGSCDLFSFFKY